MESPGSIQKNGEIYCFSDNISIHVQNNQISKESIKQLFNIELRAMFRHKAERVSQLLQEANKRLQHFNKDLSIETLQLRKHFDVSLE
ncbi:MAG: hypothetical protein IPK55_15010 [Streptococcus sp.]|nr:hypothetical protein [Streptococcus sp.]